MKFSAIVPACLLPATVLAATKLNTFNPLLRYKLKAQTQSEEPPFIKRQTQGSPFLNSNTIKFVVDGKAIPDVKVDVGQSFAGSLPVGEANNGSSMFFWFFPTTAANTPKEIVIWLNGGPGCSSLAGLLQENGPFLWPTGVTTPFANSWSWHHLTNVVFVEQPVGTGFSAGKITTKNEDDVARQFMGFWKNFVDAFGMQGYSVFITGESYAGVYCPFIASNMLDTNDTQYFDVKGMIIYDPLIWGGTAGYAPTNYFVQHWENVFPFNDTAKAQIVNASKTCGFDEYSDKYLTFPPSGQQPDVCQNPGINANCTDFLPGCDVWGFAFDAALEINPAFNVYQVATIPPIQTSVLGFPGSQMFTPPGTQIYFNRTDVKQAIHAPLDVNWEICTSNDVFPEGDNSDPSSYLAIPNVIQKTNNVQIAHGTMDMVLLANATLLAIQNMTWHGQMGFQEIPSSPIFVPHHPNPDMASASGQGVMGTWHEERGLTWLFIGLAGHMVPTFQSAVSYRQLEVLLGRVPAMNSTMAFPQYANASQPAISDLGFGTAPQLGISLNGSGPHPGEAERSLNHGHVNLPSMLPLVSSLLSFWL